VIANRVLPASLVDVSTRDLAERLAAEELSLGGVKLAGDAEGEVSLKRVLGAIGENYVNFAALAGRQRALLERFGEDYPEAIEVPHLLDEVVDVTSLLRIGNLLFADSPN
jgi:hypothetical protein